MPPATADKSKPKRPVKAPPKALRMRPAGAAALLGISEVTLYRLIAEDVFTVKAPRGRGRGKPMWLLTDEVECYAEHDADGVRLLRQRKKRL